MSDRQVTDFLVKVIGRAVKDADFPLAETAIRTLATVNPGAAQDVLGTIQRDADTLMRIIGDAIRDADFQAAEAAIRVLATTNPDRARDVLDTIQAGLMIREMTP